MRVSTHTGVSPGALVQGCSWVEGFLVKGCLGGPPGGGDFCERCLRSEGREGVSEQTGRGNGGCLGDGHGRTLRRRPHPLQSHSPWALAAPPPAASVPHPPEGVPGCAACALGGPGLFPTCRVPCPASAPGGGAGGQAVGPAAGPRLPTGSAGVSVDTAQLQELRPGPGSGGLCLHPFPGLPVGLSPTGGHEGAFSRFFSVVKPALG